MMRGRSGISGCTGAESADERPTTISSKLVHALLHNRAIMVHTWALHPSTIIGFSFKLLDAANEMKNFLMSYQERSCSCCLQVQKE
jgi:hypothetical protein